MDPTTKPAATTTGLPALSTVATSATVGAAAGAAIMVNYLVDVAFVGGARVLTVPEQAGLAAVIGYVAGVITWLVTRRKAPVEVPAA